MKTIRYWWKKLKTTQTNGKIKHAHALEESIFLNDHTSQSSLWISAIPIKIPVAFFTELEEIILNSIWKHRRQNNQTSLKKNKTGVIMLLDFILYYSATVIKTIWCWHETRHKDQWKRIESRNEPTSIWPGEGNGTPLQYFCLENPMDRGAW